MRPPPTARVSPPYPNAVILDANRKPVAEVIASKRREIVYQGSVYDHVGEDAAGRWCYAPSDRKNG